jgi:hypothetical protein
VSTWRVSTWLHCKWLFRLVVVAGLSAVAPGLPAMEREALLVEHEELVARHLLPLLHAPEVHKELKLSQSQVDQLETFFREKVDGPWFRARILPLEERAKTLRELEAQTHLWLAGKFSEAQQTRLRQLEYQAQSIRILCRADVARTLKLDASQRQQFVALAEATLAVQKKNQSTGVPADDEAMAQLKDSAKAEQAAVTSVLTAEQVEKLGRLLGEPFPTKELECFGNAKY